jgi:hypothetical protein
MRPSRTLSRALSLHAALSCRRARRLRTLSCSPRPPLCAHAPRIRPAARPLPALTAGKLRFREAEELAPFGQGAFLADFLALRDQLPLDTTLVASTNATVYRIERGDFLRFLEDNPGMLLNFLKARFVE